MYNELNEYFYKEFPGHSVYVYKDGTNITIRRTIFKSQLNNLHNFIYDRCKR